MKVKASLKNLRVSPRKVRLVTNLIKGMKVENALVQLEKTLKGSSREIAKLLKSAIANAENNFDLDRASLIVLDVQVGEGPILKRWLPRAHGRATTLLKRTSNVYLILEGNVGLDEKIKSKEDGEKEKSDLKKEEKVKKEIAAKENLKTVEKKSVSDKLKKGSAVKKTSTEKERGSNKQKQSQK